MHWFVAGAAVISVTVIMSVIMLKRGRDGAETNRRTAQGTAPKKGGIYRFIFSLAVVLGLSPEAAADECTLDCFQAGTPIPDQTKYETNVFVPPIIDLRAKNGTCINGADAHVTIAIREGPQMWGIKDGNGTDLNTTIWGYTCIESSQCINPSTGLNVTRDDFLDKPTFPGPSILVTRGCPVTITFLNELGTGRHLFDLDRTTHCGLATLDPQYCGMCIVPASDCA
jgi:hypothetical protein